jgi:hypothetical protein
MNNTKSVVKTRKKTLEFFTKLIDKKRLRPSKTQLLWAKSRRYKTANIKIERQRKDIDEAT